MESNENGEWEYLGQVLRADKIRKNIDVAIVFVPVKGD